MDVYLKVCEQREESGKSWCHGQLLNSIGLHSWTWDKYNKKSETKDSQWKNKKTTDIWFSLS